MLKNAILKNPILKNPILKNPNVKKTIKYVVILLVVAGLGGGGYYIYKSKTASTLGQGSSRELTAKVVRGNLDVSISGTGTIAPISRYDIVPLVKGNILSAPFEEGTDVKAGDLLYKIDDSDLSFNIEKAQNSIEKLKLNNQSTADSIRNLEIFAPVDGQITNFTLAVGDQVANNSKIAELVNFKQLTVVVPFNEQQVKNIHVGQNAQVMIGDFLSSVDGTVSYVSSTAKPSGGAVVYDVEVVFDNPGALSQDLEVSVVIQGQSGDIASPTTAKAAYANKRVIQAQSSGTVKQVLIKNGEWVKAGQKLLVLENDSLYVTSQKNALDLRESELSLDAQRKQLADYNILSPINGKIIKKNYKAGDTVNNTNANTILATVADLSKMIFTMAVDELDIAKVTLGQKVSVTADALPGTTFTGEVTSTSLEGTTQNGVTTYPVQVTIAEPGKLRPGMNVNAKILVESKKGVLTIPMSAVIKTGNKTYVTVKSDGAAGSQGNAQGSRAGQPPAGENGRNQQGSQIRQADGTQGGAQGSAGGQNGTGGGRGSVEGSQSNTGGGRNNTGGQGNAGSAQGAAQGTAGSAPSNTGSVSGKAASSAQQGRERREVVVGINNESSIEIISGLNEGETVYLPVISSGDGSNNRNMMGGGMGFPGGAVRIR